jgi:ribonucleoside-diphosphate reductase alpha chain
MESMYVIKRNSHKQEISFDKVIHRIKALSYNLNIDPISIAQKVCSRIYNGVTTTELDELAAQICIALITDNLDYGTLASRIVISNNHKNTSPSFSETIYILYHNKDEQNQSNPLVSELVYKVVMDNKDKLNSVMKYERDYTYDYFGFKTLEKGYLAKDCNNKILERPQHLLMRVSIGLHGKDIRSAIDSYEELSNKHFTHATPTLFHSGTNHQQLLSCFLLGTHDSIDGIYKNITDCAKISKWAGGLGVHISNIRSKNSYIKGTNGRSTGIIPMLRNYNETARYVNQGGKRPGAIAIYLEPHHPEILDFLNLKKNHGKEEERCRDLFLAIWNNDLFMSKIEFAINNPEQKVEWCLFDPNSCPGLNEVYGDEYKKLYEKYESENKYVEKVDILTIIRAIINSQIETGVPYILYKDSINTKSNQKNIGVIKSSNLCVAPETKILTDKGYFEIKDLENKSINIWNGNEFTDTIVRKTSNNTELIKVNFSNGQYIECTRYHKFYVQSGVTVEKIDAEKLQIGQKLIEHELPFIDTELNMDNAYECGFLLGEKINFHKNIYYNKNINKNYCVPINYSFETKKKWFAGLIDQIGIYNDNDNILNIESISFDFIKDIFLLLNTIGLYPIINNLNNNYILTIQSNDLYKLSTYNFKSNIYSFKNIKRTNKEFISVKNIEITNRFSETYCFTEKNRSMGIFNGIIAGNCAEITEVSNENEYACCCLASISLPSFIDDAEKIESIKIYTKSSCSFCFKAKDIFNEYKLNFEEILLDDDVQRHAFYVEQTKLLGKEIKSVPQIWINHKYVGGYTELKEYIKPNSCVNGGLVPQFNYEKLEKCCYTIVNNLNKVIDLNFYPVPETKLSNMKHRPLGIGIQGLADLFAILRIPFSSNDAKELNRKVFECIQYSCIKASMELAKHRYHKINENLSTFLLYSINNESSTKSHLKQHEILGDIFTEYEIIQIKKNHNNPYLGAYTSFEGSPLSYGLFQHNLWNFDENKLYFKDKWDQLRKDIQKYGVRNSLLTALMPTASTSQILGNNEAFEPFTSNIYSRKTLAGNFVIVNKYLVKDLMNLGLWNKNIKDMIIANNGSVQNISGISMDIKEIYKTAFEIKQKVIIDLAAERGPFICQTQSMNLFFEEPTHKTLTSAMIYGWKAGLKTGSYYIRSRPKVQAQQFTIDPNLLKNMKEESSENVGCDSCSG